MRISDWSSDVCSSDLARIQKIARCINDEEAWISRIFMRSDGRCRIGEGPFPIPLMMVNVIHYCEHPLFWGCAAYPPSLNNPLTKDLAIRSGLACGGEIDRKSVA